MRSRFCASASSLVGLTHRALAERSGVPVPSVAHYLPTKAALVDAAATALAAAEQAEFERVGRRLVADVPREQVGERLATLLGALAELDREAQFAQYEVLVHAARTAAPTEAVTSWLASYDDLFRALLTDAEVPDPDTAAAALVAFAFGAVLMQAVRPEPERLRRATALLVAALDAPPPAYRAPQRCRFPCGWALRYAESNVRLTRPTPPAR